MPNGLRSRWIDYLKSFIIVVVVAHHSALAYTTFAAFNPEAYILSTNPIVDIQRWLGLDIFVSFNDIFFMFLMFFISGLFMVRSLQKKGSGPFIKDRFKRLFIPFILGGTALMLIAYFPSYYVAKSDGNIIRYIQDFFTVESWPVGPPWFIWVLFLFNILFVILFPGIKILLNRWAEKLNRLQMRPVAFYLILFAITWILFAPVAFMVGAGRWSGIGPFDFQTSRILAYFGYFVFGALIGSTQFNQGLFGENSALVRKRNLWCILALVIFVAISLNSSFRVLERLAINGYITPAIAWMIYFTFFAASCSASCLAYISIFRQGVKKSYKWWDSLSENAYLIYLIHYVYVVWVQFFMLHIQLPAFLKFLIVFAASLLLSWGTSHLFRKIRVIRKYL